MPEFKMLIGGKLVSGCSEIEVINPATEEVIGICPIASEDQLNEAVEAATIAFETSVFVNKVVAFTDHAALLLSAFSARCSCGGLSQTSVTGFQFLVAPDQRFG